MKIRKFSIAGITFKLIFPDCQLFSQKNTIEKLLDEWLEKYVVDTEVKRNVDYTIYFIHVYETIKSSHISSLHETQTHSIDLFNQKNKNIYIRISISLEEFFIIVSFVIARHFLLHENGLLLHGSASILPDGTAALFLGKNGAGKSTLIKLLYPNYEPLSDDIIYIVKKRMHFYACSSVRTEKDSWFKKSNKCFLLKCVYFLKKSSENHEILVPKKSQLFELLLKQARISLTSGTMKTLLGLFAKIPIKNLQFNLHLRSLQP